MNDDFELLLSFCDFILENVPSISFFEKDNPNRLKLVEDFLEEWDGEYETLISPNGNTERIRKFKRWQK